MYRYVRVATAAVLMAGGLASTGCANNSGITCGDKYRNAIDTSWPDRYNYDARQAVLAPFAQQAANGHFIEQTVWSWHFEPGSDKLNSAGMEKLNSLARKTPGPDSKIYVQTARDVAFTPDNAGEIGTLRDELTAKRAAAVLKYMATQPGTAVPYEVAVHDAPTPGIDGQFATVAYRGQLLGYAGGLGGGGGSAAAAISGGSNLLTPAAPAGVTGGGAGAVSPVGSGY